MKYRMLDLICCPSCSGNFNTIPFVKQDLMNLKREIKSPRCEEYCGLKKISIQNLKDEINCSSCYRIDIFDGLLICKCGCIYPILSGVPRFCENWMTTYPKFCLKYKKQLKEVNPNLLDNLEIKNSSTNTDFKSIHDSFTKEWSFFEYNRDKTWGWNIDQRKKVFLEEIGIDKNMFNDKLLLDAGCGNGILSSILAEFNMEIVGVDISDSIVNAELNKLKFAKDNNYFVHFLQGNLFNLPLKTRKFDFIYCSGVLHHCPNTHETFNKITPFSKKGGRMYIWVYRKRGIIVQAFLGHGRFLRRIFSIEFLFHYCQAITPIYKFFTDLLSSLKIYNFRKRTKREITLDLFDAFSPKYNHTHTKEEVINWFRDQNFTKVSICGASKHGFGIRGDKI